MAKKQIFPSDAELKEIRNLLSTSPAARPLRKNADAVERIKHALCAEFVTHKNKNKLSQKQMATDLKIDEALVSKIINYLYDEFTVDRLIKYLSILYPNAHIRILFDKAA